MQFAGNLSKQATVTVAGVAATVSHQATNFTAYTGVSSGTNTVPITARDYDGNSATNTYQVVVTNNGVAETISYDANGNTTNVVTATSTNSYQWDAANRLVSITGPTNQSLFTYDGLGRRVQIIEETNGIAYVTNKYVWDKTTLCEQRNNTGLTVTKRFFNEGEQISGTNYYFTRDHLGSIREMVNSAGTIEARYAYDPYGRQTLISGTMLSDFGYAGMYFHQPSGFDLTLYRAYNADLGRWLSRDLVAEAGGLNLYDYVLNNPINWLDPYGTCPVILASQVTGGAGGGGGGKNLWHWYTPWRDWGMTGEWFEEIFKAADDRLEWIGDSFDALRAGLEMCKMAPVVQRGSRLKNQLMNGDTTGLTNSPASPITAE